MLVQINTDKNIHGHQRMNEFFKEEIQNELERFDDKVTRIEVHLIDENGDKAGKDDKKCTIEVRIEKKQPIAVTAHAETPEKAFYEALSKVKKNLNTIFEKMREH